MRRKRSRMWLKVSLAAGGLVVGSGLAGLVAVSGASASDSGGGSVCGGDPVNSSGYAQCMSTPQKRDATSLTKTADGALIEAPSGGGNFAPPDDSQLNDGLVGVSPDSGDPAAISEVKADVIADLTNQDLGQLMPARAAQRAAAVTNGAPGRRAAAAKAWAPNVLDRHVKDVEDAFRMAANDPHTLGMSDARYVVTDWQGVQVNGNTATATFIGNEEMVFSDAPSSWYVANPEQYSVALTLVSGRWLMENYHASAVGIG